MVSKPSQKIYSNFREVPVVFPIVILGEVPVVFPIVIFGEVPVVFLGEVPVVFLGEVPVVFPTVLRLEKISSNFFKSATAGGSLSNPRVRWRRCEPGGDAQWPPATQGNAPGAIHGPNHNTRLPLRSSTDKFRGSRRCDKRRFPPHKASVTGQ